ncbi:MAG: glycosyltransferase family 2 protein [Candidatus Levyibacteriota bacterium]
MNQKQEKKPLITIAIATYDSGNTIEKCLKSIQKQTYPNLDIIVVDSKYYDKYKQEACKKIITKYARYFKDGPERSIQRNRGIKEAKGEYILIIDQDMYLSPNVAEDCLNTLLKNNCHAILIPEISIGEGYWTKCVALDRYVTTYLEDGKNECCRFFSKKDALVIGGYDPTIVGAEDADFHYRMSKLGYIKKIKSIIYHDEGVTKFSARVKKKYYYSKAFRRFVQRYPDAATAQFFPLKKAYFKHWKLFIKDPLVTLGIITLRTAEVSAGILGVMIKK